MACGFRDGTPAAITMHSGDNPHVVVMIEATHHTLAETGIVINSVER